MVYINLNLILCNYLGCLFQSDYSVSPKFQAKYVLKFIPKHKYINVIDLYIQVWEYINFAAPDSGPTVAKGAFRVMEEGCSRDNQGSWCVHVYWEVCQHMEQIYTLQSSCSYTTFKHISDIKSPLLLFHTIYSFDLFPKCYNSSSYVMLLCGII